jgi:hypothetical protein
VKQLTSAQIKFVCLNVRCGRLEETTFLPLGKRESQRGENSASDLILNGEDVFDLAIEPFGPKMMPSRASTSWTVMRSRFPALRMLPSRSVSTPRRFPISRASTLVPRNAKHDVRAGT